MQVSVFFSWEDMVCWLCFARVWKGIVAESGFTDKSRQVHVSPVWSCGNRKSMMNQRGIVTVLMPGYPAKCKGEVMKNHILRSSMMFATGALVMGVATYFWPQAEIKASVANGNDKFTMVTVPLVETGELEAVFVLNHLTGVLSGAAINVQTGKFGYSFLHNVAADFQTATKTPEPKYAIVSGPANLRSTGGGQPAYGVIYIGELSSGGVIAYGFQRPTTRNVGTVMPLVKLDFFKFSDSVGQ